MSTPGDELKPGTEATGAAASPEAEAVARKLGAIKLGDWIAFGKMVVPTLVVALPMLLMPVNSYLDKREEKLTEKITAELLSGVPPAAAQNLQAAIKDIDEIKLDIKELEGELKGDLRASPTSYENMQKIAEIRERLVRIEAQVEASQ
jgi:hypothetical protein